MAINQEIESHSSLFVPRVAKEMLVDLLSEFKKVSFKSEVCAVSAVEVRVAERRRRR